jgi:hypothetical protein
VRKQQFDERGACSLCGDVYTRFGNNPEPIKSFFEVAATDAIGKKLSERVSA